MFSKKAMRWELYSDNKKRWRWRCVNVNEQTVGKSHVSFLCRKQCEKNARIFGYKKEKFIFLKLFFDKLGMC